MDDFSTFCAEFRKNKEDKKADKAPRKENQPQLKSRMDPFDHIGINLNPKAVKPLRLGTPQVHNNNKGFIKARLNRDNFWNLVFVFGMTLGLIISASFGKEYPLPAFISSWSTILGVPFLVKKGSKITLTEDKNFLNSLGEDITKRCPNIFWVIIGTLASTAFIGATLDQHAKALNDLLSFTVICFGFFLILTLFFILKNCPIALLFHKSAWRTEITGLVAGTGQHRSTSHRSSYNSLSPRSWSTDPGYRHLSGNIHHR